MFASSFDNQQIVLSNVFFFLVTIFEPFLLPFKTMGRTLQFTEASFDGYLIGNSYLIVNSYLILNSYL